MDRTKELAEQAAMIRGWYGSGIWKHPEPPKAVDCHEPEPDRGRTCSTCTDYDEIGSGGWCYLDNLSTAPDNTCGRWTASW